jgi:hypothetical protein
VQVHYDEGVAIHIGPEPCAATREGVGEASVGEHIGQPLSRESLNQSGCRRGHNHGRQHGARVIASARPARRGLRPWHVWKFLAREPGDLGFGQRRSPLVRIGKTRSRSR